MQIGGAEHVGKQAHAGERVERADRRTGGDDLDVVDSQSARIAGTTSWRMNSRNWRCIHAWCAAVALAGEQHPTVDAVDGVELDPAGVEQLAAGVDQVEALDLLGVAAGGREHQHRRAEVAPAHDVDVALDPLASTTSCAPSSCPFDSRTPGRDVVRASAGCGSQNRSVNSSTSWAGNERRHLLAHGVVGDVGRRRSPTRPRRGGGGASAQNASNSSAWNRSRAIAAYAASFSA